MFTVVERLAVMSQSLSATKIQSELVALLSLAGAAVLGACSGTDELHEPVPVGNIELALVREPAALRHWEEPPDFSPEQRQILQSLSPLPALPPDTTNQFADLRQAQELGQRLFFDTRFSGPLEVASDLGAVGEVG